jgi:hypothetical protein
LPISWWRCCADSVAAAFEVADGARGRMLDHLAAAQRDVAPACRTRRIADAERLLRRIGALRRDCAGRHRRGAIAARAW